MSDIESLRNRAKALARAKDFGNEALELNTQLINEDPTDIGSYTRLARIYYEQHFHLRAALLYDQVLDMDPQNTIARNAMETLKSFLPPSKDIALFRQALKTNDCEIIYSFGQEAKETGAADLAEFAIERAVDLCPKPQWKLALASAYRQRYLQDQGTENASTWRLDWAEEIYKDALEQDPLNEAAQVGLAAVYRSRGALEDSLKLYREVITANARNKFAHNGIAGVYMDMNEPKKAKEHFEKAIRLGDRPRARSLKRLRKQLLDANQEHDVRQIDAWLKRWEGDEPED